MGISFKLRDMNKVVLFIVLLFYANVVYSQSFSKEELNRYSGKGNGYKSDQDRAMELAIDYPLNDQNELYLSCIKEYPGQSKMELYNKIHDWILGMSSNAESAIQYADTIKGVIRTRCNIQQIAKRSMGDNHYKVNIRPLLTFDFKDGRIRFTYTLQSYDVLKKTDDDGGVFMFGSVGVFAGGGQKKDNQIWPLSECYPYANNPSHPRVTSSRALINSVAVYKILVDRVDGVLNKERTNDDW